MPVARRRGSAGAAVTVLCLAAASVCQQSSVALHGRLTNPSMALLAAESLIMTGTGMPVVTAAWMDLVSANFIEPTVGTGYAKTPVTTPAQWRPFTGPDSLTLDESTRAGSEILDARLQAVIEENRESGDPVAVFGYSQSAWIAAVGKQILMNRRAAGEALPQIDVVMLANPIRPNGGVFSRFPDLGFVTWTPVTSAPTDTAFSTYDIARQYDFFADFPSDPTNVLAVTNAIFGLMNHDYSGVTVNPDDPRYDPSTVVQQYGDTTYYLIPSKTLPLLEPLRQAGLVQLADQLEPVLTPIVESAYDRTTSYGQHIPAAVPAAARPVVPIARPARSTPAPAASAAAVHRTEKVGRSRR